MYVVMNCLFICIIIFDPLFHDNVHVFILNVRCHEEKSSSSPETNKCTASTSNLKEKKGLRHRQNRKKLLRHLQKQINVQRQLQT